MKILVDESKSWPSPSGAIALVDLAVRGGYDTIIAYPWHGSGPRWFTNYDGLAWDTAVPKPQYDPWSILLSYAQSKGIAVWAGFTLGIAQSPAIHSEWVYADVTQWTRAFDWTKPEFRTWAVGLVQDFFLKHPATPGVFLDFVRFFFGETGPLAGDNAGRIAVVTDGVTRIMQAVRAINPSVVSMSFSNVDRLYPYHLAEGNDGRMWLQQGLVKYLNCPAYDVDPRIRLAGVAQDTSDLPSGSVVPSIATYTVGTQPRTPAELLYYTETQRRLFPHVSHYFAPTLSQQAAECLRASGI